VKTDTATLVNPFPGLRPFEAAETHLFFGRDGQSSDIVARLERQRFVAVVGPSGSGKSSLVRAGLLPMLEGGFMASAGSFWRFAVMRPRNDAIRSLSVALADPAVLGGEAIDSTLRTSLVEAVLRRSSLGLIDAFKQARQGANENLLVVVDQFEEMFRFRQLSGAKGQSDDGDAFVSLLIEAARRRERPIYVVLTMRSDFLGDCAHFRDLPEILNDGQYLIPRLSRDQRRAAIEGPIAVSGATIAPRLTQRLLNDAGEDPDVLPVLQHALMRTWDAWKSAGALDRPIDLEHYLAIGGMAHALAQHADQAYDSLAAIPGAQAIAETMFRSLCERGSDYREIRRPTRLVDLCEIARTDLVSMTTVIDAFRSDGRTFIMPGWPATLDADTVIDISHESLIRQWQTLRDWVQREARSAALYQRLRQTAQLWPQNAALWRNPDLERALLWEREETPGAAWAARYGTREEFARAMEFLRASETAWREENERNAEAARLATEQELEMRTQREREARLQAEVGELRSRKRLLSAVAVLIPALVAGLGWALYNRNVAVEQAQIARKAADDETKQRLYAEDQRQYAERERARAQSLLERLTNSNRLKQAFLSGDVETIQRIASATPPDPAFRFLTRQIALGWKMSDGRPVYRYELYPSPESLEGPLKSASQISYYMNHPTFNVKLLSAGSANGFTASYNGWGCLDIVYVLIEFADPDTPPQVTHYDECSAIS
jgi:energy-coupling factor transporter ATP-binding protein EcfA2